VDVDVADMLHFVKNVERAEEEIINPESNLFGKFEEGEASGSIGTFSTISSKLNQPSHTSGRNQARRLKPHCYLFSNILHRILNQSTVIS
jgi:hypothetical protein